MRLHLLCEDQRTICNDQLLTGYDRDINNIFNVQFFHATCYPFYNISSSWDLIYKYSKTCKNQTYKNAIVRQNLPKHCAYW